MGLGAVINLIGLNANLPASIFEWVEPRGSLVHDRLGVIGWRAVGDIHGLGGVGSLSIACRVGHQHTTGAAGSRRTLRRHTGWKIPTTVFMDVGLLNKLA